MGHRKHYAESQVGAHQPRSGRSSPGRYTGPAEQTSYGKPLRTRQLPVPGLSRARKRFAFRLTHHPHRIGLHPFVKHEVRDPQSELRRLSVQLLTVQEKERQRIAADLHDGIGQSLSLIKLCMESGFQSINAGDCDRGLDLLRSTVPKLNDAIAELRRTTSDLRPPMLDDLGIIPTLSWFFRELAPVCHGKKIQKEITVAESDVPAPIKAAIFRILQEAMNNVLKHAQADVVRVCLNRSDAGIHFSIEDNGQGFDPELAFSRYDAGFGLLTMRERAISSGGVFEVESAPGLGTRVAITWRSEDAAEPQPEVGTARVGRPRKTGTRALAVAPRVMRRWRGFALLELLVVMVIIGLLAGSVGPQYFSQIGKSQVKTARAQIDPLGKALSPENL